MKKYGTSVGAITLCDQCGARWVLMDWKKVPVAPKLGPKTPTPTGLRRTGKVALDKMDRGSRAEGESGNNISGKLIGRSAPDGADTATSRSKEDQEQLQEPQRAVLRRRGTDDGRRDLEDERERISLGSAFGDGRFRLEGDHVRRLAEL